MLIEVRALLRHADINTTIYTAVRVDDLFDKLQEHYRAPISLMSKDQRSGRGPAGRVSEKAAEPRDAPCPIGHDGLPSAVPHRGRRPVAPSATLGR